MSFKVTRKTTRTIPPVIKQLAVFSKEIVEIVTNTAYRAARRNAIVDTGAMRRSIKKRIEEGGNKGVVWTDDPGAPTQEFSPRGFPLFRPAGKAAGKRYKRETKKFLAELDKKKKTETESGG